MKTIQISDSTFAYFKELAAMVSPEDDDAFEVDDFVAPTIEEAFSLGCDCSDIIWARYIIGRVVE